MLNAQNKNMVTIACVHVTKSTPKNKATCFVLDSLQVAIEGLSNI
jgi:hypothetical protein